MRLFAGLNLHLIFFNKNKQKKNMNKYYIVSRENLSIEEEFPTLSEAEKAMEVIADNFFFDIMTDKELSIEMDNRDEMRLQNQ
jgi:hypothetical protein